MNNFRLFVGCVVWWKREIGFSIFHSLYFVELDFKKMVAVFRKQYQYQDK
jgi:hypothetical protein